MRRSIYDLFGRLSTVGCLLIRLLELLNATKNSSVIVISDE